MSTQVSLISPSIHLAQGTHTGIDPIIIIKKFHYPFRSLSYVQKESKRKKNHIGQQKLSFIIYIKYASLLVHSVNNTNISRPLISFLLSSINAPLHTRSTYCREQQSLISIVIIDQHCKPLINIVIIDQHCNHGLAL